MSSSEVRPEPAFLFLGERPWLDFVNTEIRVKGESVDLIESYADLVQWLNQAGLITRDEALAVRGRWAKTAAGRRAVAAARELRADLRRLAERLASGGAVSPAAIETINAALRRRQGSPQLEKRAAGVLEKRFVGGLESVDGVLALVAEAAADSLASDDLSLIRHCAGSDCVLVFLDTTKNHRRRWCSMDTCGSRAKAAAYYERTKRARP